MKRRLRDLGLLVAALPQVAVMASFLWLAGCANQPAEQARTDPLTESDEPEARRRARIRMELAVGYFEQGQTSVALDEIKQVIQVDPSYPDAYNLRGLVYMRLNDNTEPGKETVRAMDILFPGIGEIVGGSQREERHDVLLHKMRQLGIDEDELWWYLDTRRFGSAVHSGFGLGFERLVLFVTGMTNIRDVIPFPRTPGNAAF